jgi:fumarylacetoacetate (FAA) hydrolase family protein
VSGYFDNQASVGMVDNIELGIGIGLRSRGDWSITENELTLAVDDSDTLARR